MKKTVKITESRLRQIIREAVEDALNNGNEDVEFAKSMIQSYKQDIIDKVEYKLENADYSQFDFEEDDETPIQYARESFDDFECEFEEDGAQIVFTVGFDVNIAAYPGVPGDYLNAPTPFDYETDISDVCVNGFYYSNGDKEIFLDSNELGDIHID